MQKRHKTSTEVAHFYAATWTHFTLRLTPDTRGAGVGRALINAVSERCNAHGVTTLYWHTEDTNHTAQRLYDTLATKVPFLKYDKAVNDA